MISHETMLKRRRLTLRLVGAVLLVVLLGLAWNGYRNRVQLGLVDTESPEYVAEVQRRFVEDGGRFLQGDLIAPRSAVEEWMRKKFDARDHWFSSVNPKVEGRVAFFRWQPSADPAASLPLGTSRPGEPLAPGHFLIPRSSRADDPRDVRTVVWADFISYTILPPDHLSHTYRKVVRVYNLTSGTYYESGEMDQGEVDQYVFTLAGG